MSWYNFKIDVEAKVVVMNNPILEEEEEEEEQENVNKDPIDTSVPQNQIVRSSLSQSSREQLATRRVFNNAFDGWWNEVNDLQK